MKLEEIETFTVHKLDASVPSSLGTFVHTPFSKYSHQNSDTEPGYKILGVPRV